MSLNLKSGFWKDSMLTLFASGAVTALNVLFTAIISRAFVQADFEAYLFSRRFIALIFPLTTLSVGAGLTWSIASRSGDRGHSGRMLAGTAAITLAANLIFLAAALLLPSELVERHIFPSPGDSGARLWLFTLLFLTAYSAYVLLYSYCRGMLWIFSANAINLGLNGLAPIGIILTLHLAGRNYFSPEMLLGLWAAVYALCAVPLVSAIFSVLKAKGLLASVKDSLSGPVSYGLARIPAGFMLGFPAFILPFQMMKNGIDSLHILSAMLVFQMIGYISDPMAQVLLPHASRHAGTAEGSDFGGVLNSLVKLAIYAGLVLGAMIFALSDCISTLWFGPGFSETGKAIAILSFGALPALSYAPLRSVLDGLEKKALVTRHLFISSLFVLISSSILATRGMLDTSSAAWVIVASSYIVFILLMISVASRMPIKFCVRSLGVSIFAALASGGGTILAAKLINPSNAPENIVLLLTASAFCILLNVPCLLICGFRIGTFRHDS